MSKTTFSKRFYRIKEAADLIKVKNCTLRYWEEVFPMFNPIRLPSGQRRYSEDDIKMAMYIEKLLHKDKLKIEAAVSVMEKCYRKSGPRRLRKCETPEDAIALLNEVKATTEDAHALAKIEAVEKWINGLDKPIIHKNIRGKEYYAKAIEESRNEY